MEINLLPTINQVAQPTPEVQWWWELTKLIVPTVLGALVAIIAFFLKDRFTSRKEKQRNIQSYLTLLYSIHRELTFYKGKLEFLRKQLDDTIQFFDGKSYRFETPTYSIYPSFLENSKSEIMSFHRDADMIDEVTHCHYELCHVLERMKRHSEKMKEFKQLAPPNLKDGMEIWIDYQENEEMKLNVMGFRGLVDNCIKSFENARSKLKVRMEEILEQNKSLELTAASAAVAQL